MNIDNPNRPMLDPKIRLAVNVPQAEERFTASVEDSLQAEVNNRTRERGVETTEKLITNFIIDDEVIFDIGDDVTSLNELQIIQEEIKNAFEKLTPVTVSDEDIVVKADIVRTFTIGLQ